MKFNDIAFASIVLLYFGVSPAHVLAEQYAFLVGVRDYSLHGELNSLKYTESDVRKLAKTLYVQGVPAENILLMTQQVAVKTARRSPRRNQILKELNLLLSELGPNDSLIVGFSGHGLQFEGESDNYFCPLDAQPSDKSTLISLSDVYQQLEACPAQSKILLVDACRDDPLAENAKSTKRIELQPVTDRKPPVISGGTAAIFSCSPSQQSFESRELGSGVFFHFINRALSGEADSDDDNIVDLPELQFFTVKSVQKWARVNLSRRQIPEVLGRVRGAMSIVKLSVPESGSTRVSLYPKLLDLTQTQRQQRMDKVKKELPGLDGKAHHSSESMKTFIRARADGPATMDFDLSELGLDHFKRKTAGPELLGPVMSMSMRSRKEELTDDDIEQINVSHDQRILDHFLEEVTLLERPRYDAIRQQKLVEMLRRISETRRIRHLFPTYSHIAAPPSRTDWEVRIAPNTYLLGSLNNNQSIRQLMHLFSAKERAKLFADGEEDSLRTLMVKASLREDFDLLIKRLSDETEAELYESAARAVIPPALLGKTNEVIRLIELGVPGVANNSYFQAPCLLFAVNSFLDNGNRLEAFRLLRKFSQTDKHPQTVTFAPSGIYLGGCDGPSCRLTPLYSISPFAFIAGRLNDEALYGDLLDEMDQATKREKAELVDRIAQLKLQVLEPKATDQSPEGDASKGPIPPEKLLEGWEEVLAKDYSRDALEVQRQALRLAFLFGLVYDFH